MWLAAYFCTFHPRRYSISNESAKLVNYSSAGATRICAQLAPASVIITLVRLMLQRVIL